MDIEDVLGTSGYDINCRDFQGNTSLHLAAQNALPEQVDSLLSTDGCDVDLPNNAGDTPLHLAVRITDAKVRHEIVSALHDAGAEASTRHKNKAGQTPQDLCKIHCVQDTEVMRLASPPVSRQLNEMVSSEDCEDGDQV